ncbi:MAG: hypothetical protein V3573_13135 [Desulfovibrionaceae bacterium]
MKVCYTLPARGVLRISDAQPIVLYDWNFFFQINEHTQFVDRIIVEIQNVPEENWPTLHTVEQDPNAIIPRFPFAVNEDALKYIDIHDKIVALESILSVFGLWAIDYSKMEEEWIPQEGDNKTSIMGGWKLRPRDNWDNTEPVNNGILARCIIAAGAKPRDYVSAAHYRLGREHFENCRYIETVRHLFFFLEYEYGEGQFSTKGLVYRFSNSTELKQVLTEEINQESNVALRRICSKLRATGSEINETDLIKYIVDLRGSIQHANKHTHKKWHPSRDEEFEYDAVFLMNVVGTICHSRVHQAIAGVPTSDQ